ncbi:MAG: helix-turn-helix transcriptional regulator [Oscillospiraceae bacterium]|nr:helix-turn-helix transcriptional regulator [Oscillospiraceae bacterium]
MLFGDKLKQLRLSANMTQEQLAAKCGMKKQNISRYENSDREPNIRTAKKMADALGVSLEELIVESFSAVESTDDLFPDEINLIQDYRTLSPSGKEYIRQTMAMAVQSYAGKNHALSDVEDAK